VCVVVVIGGVGVDDVGGYVIVVDDIGDDVIVGDAAGGVGVIGFVDVGVGGVGVVIEVGDCVADGVGVVLEGVEADDAAVVIDYEGGVGVGGVHVC